MRRELIYDILERVGISVDAWHRTATGRPVKRPKANPHFCYNWSFGSPVEGYAICLWHDELKLEDGQVLFAKSPRAIAQDRRIRSIDPNTPADARSGLAEQASRGEKLASVIEDSFNRRLPLRVIVCLRKDAGTVKRRSSASRRELDEARWHVAAYDPASGKCRINRGLVAPPDREEQIETDVREVMHRQDLGPTEKDALIKARRGQGTYRRQMLELWNGQCAVTGLAVQSALVASHAKCQ